MHWGIWTLYLVGLVALLGIKGQLPVSGRRYQFQACSAMLDPHPNEPAAGLNSWLPLPVSAAPLAQEEDTAKYSGIWLWSGAIILFGGIYLALFKWVGYQESSATPTGLQFTPPGSLAPAIAGAIQNKTAAVNWRLALATLFDLASQGYLAIDQISPGDPSTGRFAIRLKAEPFQPRPYEAGLVDLLLTDEKGQRQESVNLSRLPHLLRGDGWRSWANSVESELILLGLVKPGRQELRESRLRMARILFMLSLLVGLVSVIFHATFGRWPLYLAVPLLVHSLLLRSIGVNTSVLTDEGAKVAADWAMFHAYIRQVSRGEEWPVKVDDLPDLLPYAAAYGLATSWTKRFGGWGLTVTPDYFRPLNMCSPNAMRDFATMVSASGRMMWLGTSRFNEIGLVTR